MNVVIMVRRPFFVKQYVVRRAMFRVLYNTDVVNSLTRLSMVSRTGDSPIFEAWGFIWYRHVWNEIRTVRTNQITLNEWFNDGFY